MHIDISSAINQVETAKRYWDQAAPTLSPQENLQGLGVDVSDIAKSFEEVIALLRAVDGSEVIDGVAWSQYKTNFDSIPSQMSQFFNAHWNNPAQVIASTSSICTWLWSLKTSLLHLLPIHPESARLSPDFEQAMTAKINEAQAWFARAEEIKASIQGTEESTAELLRQIQEQQNNSASASQAIQTLLTAIQGYEREAGTAKTNTESSASTATTEATSVSKMAQELAASISQKDALFKEFADHREEIAGLLENANKVGLARSFHEKRKELEWTWRAWAGAFLVGIGGLLWISFAELLPLLKAGVPDPAAVVLRFLVAGPLVWFAWFAARQYGHVLRVSEDYAFKEAAAMAFAGYRNEMGADAEMLKLLQESAIRNFGANPAKMLLKRADAASPLHELLEKVLEKAKPNEIIDALAQLLKK
jgi:hypothetical protein